MRTNIADLFFEKAIENGNKTAIKLPSINRGKIDYPEKSFACLHRDILIFENGFKNAGITKGMKTLVFIRPGLDFPAVTFALFSLGAVAVFIDPGMGKKNLLRAIEEVRPEALVAETEVHLIRLFHRKAFKSIKHAFSNGRLKIPGVRRLRDFAQNADIPGDRPRTQGDDLAAILFTSGGTGIPKGVEYTHDIFWNQTLMLQKMFHLTSDDIDVPGFPLFGLFTLAMGMTIVPPLMNPSRPAAADPGLLIRNIVDTHATFVAGSPAIWEKVADHCLKNNIILESVRYVVMFGAPVSNRIHEKFRKILKNGDTYTPYGATECLPVSLIKGTDVLDHTSSLTDKGAGTCIGWHVDGVEIRIVPISDGPLEWKDLDGCLPWQIGEILVSSSTTTQRYYARPSETKLAKVIDDTGEVWHRMGDLGYLDDQNRLWFCGRKTHRVELDNKVLTSIQCEAIFNQHDKVRRTALIGLQRAGRVHPAIVVETLPGTARSRREKEKISYELMNLADKFDHTREIREIFFHDHFPVDVRHNIKIDRLALRDMAVEGKL